MRIEPFEYLRPATVQEACQVLAEHPGDAHVLAGGTDLIPRLKQQIVRPTYLLDMGNARDYGYIRGDAAAGLAIGAGTPLHAVETSNVIREQAPLLAIAASKVASQQIRNVATLGGNLCVETRCWFYNQSHAWKQAKPECFKAGGKTCHVVNKPDECYAAYQGDTAAALLALGASVKLISVQGERIITIEQLYTGQGQSPLSLAPDELLAEIQIPAPSTGSGTSYVKFSHRKAVDFPLAGIAVWLNIAPGNGKCLGARLALTGVGSAPVRVPKAEQSLIGQDLEPAVIAEAAQAAVKVARPVKNLHHGSPALRRKMVGILTRLAIEEAAEQARNREENKE